MRAHLSAALIGAAFTLASCANLSSIDRASCGNAIVEPEAGEDCDSFPADQCHAPGSKYQCRFACDPATSKGCPEGWGCGSEGVCRQPTSTFGAASRPSARPIARIFAADFDGDGRRDIAGLSPGELQIHYFDDADPFGGTLMVRPAAMPSIADLTPSDPAADLAMVASGTFGVSVLHGRSDRSLLPLPYSFLSAPDEPLSFLSLEAMPDDLSTGRWIGEEALLLYGKMILTTGEGPGEQIVFALPQDISQAAGPLQVASFWEDPVRSPCDEIALTWKDASEVSVLTPCKCTNCPVPPGTPPAYAVNSKAGALASVALPPGVKATSGALAAHLNRDAHTDLVLTTGGALYVAYGLGDGTFASSLEMVESTPPLHDDKFGKVEVWYSTWMLGPDTDITLLAAGLADGDAIPDLVISLQQGSVVLRSLPSSKAGAWRYAPIASADTPWTGAKFGDFNLDGWPDIVAWSDQARDIQFLSGTEVGYLNQFDLRTDGVPSVVRVADVDGDNIDDLAYVDRAPGLDDSLNIMFGRLFGAPEEPVQVARYTRIDEIVPTHMPILTIDRAADLLVLTKDAAGKRGISVFMGATNRLVQSPLWLFNDEVPDSLPMLTTVGDFVADPNHQPDLIALSSQPAQSLNGLPTQRLWLVPMHGDALVDPNQVVPGTPLPRTIRAEMALTAAVDLDGNGGEQELVMLAPDVPSVGQVRGSLLTARVNMVNDKLQLEMIGDPQQTPEVWAIPMQLSAYAGASSDQAAGGLVRAVDIDADGRTDIAAIGQLLDGESIVNTLVVFPNAGTGSLSAADAIRVPNNTGGPLQAFAFVQADLDPQLELVLLGKEQAWLVQPDLAARSFSDPVLLEGVGGGADALAEDFDRDGIHDLVIVGGDGLRFHKGMAVLP